MVTTDAAVLRAVAHPLRRRILDVLRVDGPQTASLLAVTTGQAVANLSHHLKVLAEAGLVVEAPELARNRKERWWRMESRTVAWSSKDFRDDPAEAAAADAAESLGLQRQLDLIGSWLGSPASHEEPWADAAISSDFWLRLSPAELTELGQELFGVIVRYRDRPPADDSEPVFLLARGFPARP